MAKIKPADAIGLPCDVYPSGGDIPREFAGVVTRVDAPNWLLFVRDPDTKTEWGVPAGDTSLFGQIDFSR